jgi:hypothetical protein
VIIVEGAASGSVDASAPPAWIPFAGGDGEARAKLPKRPPIVLTRAEVRAVMSRLKGETELVVPGSAGARGHLDR